MVSRRAAVGLGLLALFLVTSVEYHGEPSGLVAFGLFALGGWIGYRTGGVLRGGVYGALAGVGLAVVATVLGAVAFVLGIVLTIPQHGGWGFLTVGLGASMLASSLGIVLAGVVLAGVALVGGAGGLVGGAIARGGDLSRMAR